MAEPFPFHAVTEGMETDLEYLLKSRKSSIRFAVDTSKNSLLHLAINHEKSKLVQMLISHVIAR